MGSFRILPSALLLSVVAACSSGSGSDDGATGGGNDIPVIEVPLDHDDGTARPIAWAVDPIPNLYCWHPSHDDAVFTVSLTDRTTIAKVSRKDLMTPLYSSTKTFGADVYYVECPTVVDASDGGAYVVGWLQRAAPGGTAAVGVGIARIAEDGSTVWSKTISDAGKNGAGVSGVAVLSTGTLAVSFKTTPAPGSLEVEAWVIGYYDESGNELGRTPVPDVHLSQYDHPGRGIADRSPGTGSAHPRALSALPGGGLLAAGTWDFLRYIQCGSEDDPEDPVTTSCSDGASNGFVAKIGPSFQVEWTARLGSAYSTSPMVLTSVAAGSDGSVLAAGPLNVELRPTPGGGHLMGVAARLGSDGSVKWLNAYPWGRAPGAGFFEGGTSIDAVVPAASGGFDAMFHPSNESNCRVVHIDDGGNLSHVQEVKHPVGAASGYAGPCLASALDGAMTFSILGSFSRIERASF